MKVKISLLALLLASCGANHSHDGLYIANRAVTGVTKAWIIQGDALTIYSMGVIDVTPCEQYADRVQVKGGDVYRFDVEGNVIIDYDTTRNADLRMMKVSDRTNYNIGELDKLVSDAYQNERKRRK